MLQKAHWNHLSITIIFKITAAIVRRQSHPLWLSLQSSKVPPSSPLPPPPPSLSSSSSLSSFLSSSFLCVTHIYCQECNCKHFKVITSLLNPNSCTIILQVAIPEKHTTYWCWLIKAPKITSRHHITKVDVFSNRLEFAFQLFYTQEDIDCSKNVHLHSISVKRRTINACEIIVLRLGTHRLILSRSDNKP